MARVVVIGGGPSGSVFSARMAQMGHATVLIERAATQSSRLGESLTPGVLPLLDTIGAANEVADSGARLVRHVRVRWQREIDELRDRGHANMVVDRGRLDARLRARAQALGVRVLQPATLRHAEQSDGEWSIRISLDGREEHLRADFVADATGRAGALSPRRNLDRVRTIALYAYWRCPRAAELPAIGAGPDAWSWIVPLPDGSRNVLVFVDPGTLSREPGSRVASTYHTLLDRSSLREGLSEATQLGPVRAIDATPYLDEEAVATSSIRIGDAALAIDPLSSSGVQRAIQTALAGAVVANTLLRRKERAAAAIEFYQSMLTSARTRHRVWAGAEYAAALPRFGGRFWSDRAAVADAGTSTPARHETTRVSPASPVRVSGEVQFLGVPCIDGELVSVKPGVRHPDLPDPLVYYGRWEIARLLEPARRDLTMGDLLRSWSNDVPAAASLDIARWLLANRLLLDGAAVSGDGDNRACE